MDPSIQRNKCTVCTGKSLSEALIFASTNPQYDDRFVHWITGSIHEKSKLKPGENMLCTEIVSDIQTSDIFDHNMFYPCSEKRRASDKDLPVQLGTQWKTTGCRSG